MTVRQKQKGVPWINDEYIQLARDRDYYRKKFNQTKENQYCEKYKFYRNKANNLNKLLIEEELLKSASFKIQSNEGCVTDHKKIAEI